MNYARCTLTNNRTIPVHTISISKFLPLCGAVCKRPRHGRDDCLRRQAGKGGVSLPGPPCAVNKMTSKVRAGTRRACDRRWQRRDRHEPPGERTRNIPVPQGERGILWARPGQLSHLPPPAVGIMALTSHKRLGYSRPGLKPGLPGVSSRAVLPPGNTANIFGIHYVME